MADQFDFINYMLTMGTGEALDQLQAMRNKYLDMHTTPIVQGKGEDRRWSTRVRDDTKSDGWRIIRKATREEVEKEVIQYYMNREKAKEATKIRADILVGEYFLRWIEYKKRNRELSAETFRKYRNDYNRFLKDTEFSQKMVMQVDFIDIESFLAEKTEELNLKRRAVSNLAGYLRNMFNLAIRDRLIYENPFCCVDLRNNVYPMCCREEKTGRERILTASEVSDLIEVLKRRHIDYPTYMPDWAIEICLWTGLRVGEVVALRWDDIRGGELLITKSEHRIPHQDVPDEYIIGETKNHKERSIPIGKELQKVFLRIRQVHSEYGIDSEFIVADAEGRITGPEVSNAMYRRGREAGARACSIHAIRRTVSSRLNTQYDRATVAHIMGHTEEVNSLHYDYDTVALNHKQSVMDQLYAV